MVNCSDSTGLPTNTYKVENSAFFREVLVFGGKHQQFSCRSVLWGYHCSGIFSYLSSEWKLVMNILLPVAIITYCFGRDIEI